MSEKILVHVTEKDIEEGRQADSSHCPVARAIKRQVICERVGVWPCTAVIVTEYLHVEVSLPGEMSEPIMQFDKTGKMEPTCFWLPTKDVLFERENINAEV